MSNLTELAALLSEAKTNYLQWVEARQTVETTRRKKRELADAAAAYCFPGVSIGDRHTADYLAFSQGRPLATKQQTYEVVGFSGVVVSGPVFVARVMTRQVTKRGALSKVGNPTHITLGDYPEPWQAKRVSLDDLETAKLFSNE